MTVRCEWYEADAKCARALAEYLLRALINSAISDASIKYQGPYNRVRGAFSRYVRGEVAWNQL
jgi:hypothetical protein